MKQHRLGWLLCCVASAALAQIEKPTDKDIDAAPPNFRDVIRGKSADRQAQGGDQPGQGGGPPAAAPGSAPVAAAAQASRDPRNLAGAWGRFGMIMPGTQQITYTGFEPPNRPGPKAHSSIEITRLCIVSSAAALTQAMVIHQTPTLLTLVMPGSLRLRHVYLNAEHPANPALTYAGHSVGRWEGNTLVIDTVAMKGTLGDLGTLPEGAGGGFERYDVTMATPTLHMVERLSKRADNTALDYVASFDDPAGKASPYSISMVLPFNRSYRPDPLEEFCEDGADLYGPAYAQ
ncbi:MAG: hypothetical protein QM718_04035 [Steroidobacteraceae bacterium]